MARLCEFPGLAPLSRFGRQPNVSHKLKEKAVSEQAAKQPTIETGFVCEV